MACIFPRVAGLFFSFGFSLLNLIVPVVLTTIIPPSLLPINSFIHNSSRLVLPQPSISSLYPKNAFPRSILYSLIIPIHSYCTPIFQPIHTNVPPLVKVRLRFWMHLHPALFLNFPVSLDYTTPTSSDPQSALSTARRYTLLIKLLQLRQKMLYNAPSTSVSPQKQLDYIHDNTY
jgi:hypothetical protein